MTLILDPQLILVDEEDSEIGIASKTQAHALGLLHRAFSLFIFDDEGRLLLQRRSQKKYHSPGLWSNTCCGHPFPGEGVKEAGERRLREEMGFTVPLTFLFRFCYRAELPNGLIENEVDHVFIGRYSAPFTHNPDEVMEWRYISLGELDKEHVVEPHSFSAWFHLAYPRVREHIRTK